MATPSRSTLLTGLLLVAFLVSGATGLIYEVLWTRMLTFWFGATAHAIATVLTAFMGGLALGGWLGGRAAERWPDRPLKLYAAAEVLVAITAIGLQFLLEHAAPLMGFFAETFPGTGPVALGVRFAVLCVLLLVPTVAMGATFPLFCQGLITHRISVHRGVSLAYGANVLGAALGCLITAYWLLETFGVHTSVFIAAGLNLLAAAIVGGIGQGAGEGADEPAGAPVGEAPLGGGPALLLGLVGLSGATAMAFEVLWSRIARQALGLVNPFLAFALVLSLVLIGMALGSLLLTVRKPTPRQSLGLFGRVQLCLAVLAVLSLGVVRWGLAGVLPLPTTAALMVATVVVMMTASVLTGMNFPLLGAVYAGREEQLGLRLGRIYAASTLGGVIGSVAGGFVLVPVFGTRWSLLVLAVSHGAAAVLVFTVALGRSRRAVPGLAGAVLAVGVLGFVTPDVPEFECPSCTILWLDDGLEATTVVADSPNMGGTLLFTDGKAIVANDQKNRALVPMLVVPSRQTVLLIGFGTGLSAWQVLENFPGTRVESAELDGNMAHTAHFFGTEGLWSDPDFHLEIADGRQHMLATQGRYDLIINDTWTQAINHEVYSSGFFGVAREALTDDGTFYIRVPLEDLNRSEDLEVILRTAAESFPYAYAMVTTGLSAILGRTRPLPDTPFRYDLLSPQVQRSFPFRFRRDDVVRIDEAVLARLETDRVNSDDRPWFFPLQRGVDPSHGERMKRTVGELLGVSTDGPRPGRRPPGPPPGGPPSPPPSPPR